MSERMKGHWQVAFRCWTKRKWN